MTHLPYHHRPKSVFRFADVLGQLTADPTKRVTVSFDPSLMFLSVDTAIARLRDAVHSFSHGLTTHPSVDAQALRAVWPRYKITSDGERVVLSPKSEEKATPEVARPQDDVLAVLRTDDPFFEKVLVAFAVLLGHRVLQGKVRIVGQFDPQSSNASLSDVVFQPDGDTTLMF